LVLTGAGISAESGIPTFRGAGGLWRQFKATVCFCIIWKENFAIFKSKKDLATQRGFAR
ncbi:unnamed protein product, partial [Rotaria sp. Silwood2]